MGRGFLGKEEHPADEEGLNQEKESVSWVGSCVAALRPRDEKAAYVRGHNSGVGQSEGDEGPSGYI